MNSFAKLRKKDLFTVDTKSSQIDKFQVKYE